MLDETKYDSFNKIHHVDGFRRLSYWVVGLFSFMILFMTFTPWTQTVAGKGKVSTLRPEQQPHTINSVISGKVEKWYVIEGQHVKKGDTLAFISEVKSDYFNPDLLQNIDGQLENKKATQRAYSDKSDALYKNIQAIRAQYEMKRESLKNKVSQYKNKVTSDSANVIAQENKYAIAEIRFERIDSLYNEGIKSRKDWETYQVKLQETRNYLITAVNKYEISKSEFENSKIELSNITNEINNKLSKAESDRFSAISNLENANKELGELENKRSSISIRQGNYYVRALQDSYVFKTYKKGLGEIVKEGEPLISMIPSKHDLAVELYISPMDIALVNIGERNRLMFDGWPSMAVSGWPSLSVGVFSGEVYAIDRSISPNGDYRILIIPDKEDIVWPEQLMLGSGVRGIFLLNDVPVWYEIWRQISGFPPDYYDGGKSSYKLDESIDKKYHTK